MRCWLTAFEPGDAARVGRTSRALHAAGFAPQVIASQPDLAAQLCSFKEPALIVAAGAWFVRAGELPPIPSSATGRPLIALGALRESAGAEVWHQALATRGGDFDRRAFFAAPAPLPQCAWLEPEAAQKLGEHLQRGASWAVAWQRLLGARAFRKVHLPALDVRHAKSLRVLQVITSIQLGGAERVTLDLAHELSQQGVGVAVVALGRPTRAAFPEPPNFTELSRVPGAPEARGEAVAQIAREFGADLVHGHLLTGEEARAIRARGLPLFMTLHNMPAGWPVGVGGGDAAPADVILACSRAVEAQTDHFGVPVRTIWNGIAPTMSGDRRKFRARFGWGDADFVLAVLANPRAQKRLERLPEIIARLAKQLAPRAVRLLLAGAPARGSADAGSAAERLAAAIAASPVRESLQWIGAAPNVGDVLAAGDVLLSVSAFEGLSLAQLEALAAGRPVVATDVGGTREIPGVTLVAEDATDETIVDALARIAASAPTVTLPQGFTRREMAARTRWLYPRVLAPRGAGEGVWLITNNFSTGGAQSSARRLLLGLAARGEKVRAAVVEEHPSQPTPGRAALIRAGIPVLAVFHRDEAEATARLLAAIEADRPRAVLFWNLIPGPAAEGLPHL